MTPKTVCLVDADCFYSSCETLFNPSLRGKPIVVLSATEASVISRSKEVKELGIPLGAPIFQYQHLVERHEIRLFAPNFALYFDMSSRMMLVLATYAEAIEQYSVDEMWLSFADRPTSAHLTLAAEMRQAVKLQTGLAVSVAVAPSKILAKATMKLAKKAETGIAMLSAEAAINCALAQMPVEEVWLVGSRRGATLRAAGICTALDLKQADPSWVRKKLTVVGERIVWELRGQVCLPIEQAYPARKQLGTAKAFGAIVEKLADLKQAAARSVVLLAEKLRAQKSLAKVISVSLATNPFHTDQPQYANALTVHLVRATNDTSVLIEAALRLIVALFKEGYHYHRVGIFLLGLVADAPRQLDFLSVPEELAHREDIMRLLDEVNRRCGAGSLTFAAAGAGTPFWVPKRSRKSPSYTTKITDLPKAR